ncbi:HSL1 [Symbiodinium natans]|uniref:HSL1 protein n=1 Tax=Symbiodinium natans TaxID=878477 RepID=A0A812QBC3_9DINO|nr:HSL1 [Symbiodinium natans]
MHKSWVQSIIAASNKEGPRVVSGEHELGFKEMFLQSRALEHSIEVIVSEPSLREHYMDPPTPDDKTSAVACLYELLSKTLAFPAAQWQGLLRVAMSGGLPGEDQTAWITTAITAMKMDWSEEVLYSERKELALRAEFLKQELKQLETGGTDEQNRKRVDTSSHLLRTYDAVRQNLQTSQAQRDEVRHLREQDLQGLQQQIQARMAGLQSFAESCTSQQKDLEGELNQSQDGIKLQLQHMDEVRAGIDKEIDELDERKRQLRIELDTVSRQLDEARMKQKQHMENCDRQRAEFYNTKSALKEKLDAASADGAAKAKEKELLDQTRQLIEETGSALQQTVREQTEDLKQKQAEFQSHFKLLLLDHLRYSEGRAKELQAEAQKAVEAQEPASGAYMESILFTAGSTLPCRPVAHYVHPDPT